MILKCTCKHENQDSIHGKFKRVHNPTMNEDKYRCTVCSTINDKPKYVEPKVEVKK